ncbi:MerR family transcriptional regulator [Flavobacterium sp. J372]|uniref:MerR family transcriptional regulator n=1 Tax=Flavobacterium sp. J372 TaxID=2898436 RepID=UPI002151640F|nr:MerR family transcriptional regulator [Flavobacterium sp. J372]MCR5863016.1 MerR family transcriptional regulator [Flavobacterium sp. J372]
MNNIKTTFNIKDLENLSGIKAHTIRIWEKRYKVLEPMRTDTNIRVYDSEALQKLLNISTLNSFGYKISNIAKMPQEKVPQLVRDVLSNKSMANHVLSTFKLAMMNFDKLLFLNTYDSLLKENSFRDIFYKYFIPLLREVGELWQTGTITPAHEHFISFLVKQKIIANIELLQAREPYKLDRTYVLYLPMNEIHELGLMLVNYELMLNGCKTVYLGESVPVSCLKGMHDFFDNITFITYMTVEPQMADVNTYISQLKEEVLNVGNSELYVLGRNTQFMDPEQAGSNVTVFGSIQELADIL